MLGKNTKIQEKKIISKSELTELFLFFLICFKFNYLIIYET